MAITHFPDKTCGIDVPGYEQIRFKKIYQHPRRRHPLKEAAKRATAAGLVFPALDEIAALRTVAGEQYNAHLPHLTRTALWQWNEDGRSYLMLEHNSHPLHNSVMQSASELFSVGELTYRKQKANWFLAQKKGIEKLCAIEQDYHHAELSLAEAEKDPFLQRALRRAITPYLTHLCGRGHSSLHITLPRLDPSDNRVHISALVLGIENELLFTERTGFAIGTVPNDYKPAHS